MTGFELKVYKAALEIPLGQTRSYKWIARKIGSGQAARAVGQALKNNPWPLIIPCHRVIAASGAIGGYSQGAYKKKLLLDLERQIAKMLYNETRGRKYEKQENKRAKKQENI